MGKEVDDVLGNQEIKVTIGGKEYVASTLTIGDFKAFRQRVKRDSLSLLLESGKEAGLGGKELTDAIKSVLTSGPDVVLDKDGKVESVKDPAIDAMGTEDGMLYILYLSIKKKHPDVKLEDLDISLGELVQLTDVIAQISAAGMPEVPKEKKGPTRGK